MLTELGELVYDRLNAQVTSAEVWAKRQAQQGDKPSVVYDLQVGPRGQGTAEIASVLLIVTCYDETSDGVEAVAAQVQTALQDWGAWGTGVGLFACDQTNALQDFDDVKSIWYAVLSFSATAISGG